MVGIKRLPTANELEVNGSASKTTAGSWLANSDRRIKKNIEAISDALETMAKVVPVSFRYTDEYRASHGSIADREYVNVVAQDFARVFPDYVKGSGEHLPNGEEILQVDTYPLTIYSTAAIQELHEITKQQAKRLAELEATIARLEDDRGADPTMHKSSFGPTTTGLTLTLLLLFIGSHAFVRRNRHRGLSGR